MKKNGLQILLWLSTAIAINAQQTINIDVAIQYQTMRGFGASDAWNIDYVGNYWSEEAKETIAEKLFSKEVDSQGNPSGIGLSRWRFNIGAGSAGQGQNSNIDMAERRVECFLNEDGSYDWTKQAGQQWFLQKASDYGVEELVAFLNSPPRFYTKNGRANSDNTTKGGPTNLKSDQYNEFAAFMASVLKHFKDQGMPFAQISPVNEPQYEWNNGQEGCPWQNMEIKTLVGKLDSAIKKENLETKILIAEAGSYDYLHKVHGSAQASDQIWRFFDQGNSEYLAGYEQVLPGIGGHGYWTDDSDSRIREARQNIAREAKEQGNLELYQTEYNLLSKDYDNKLQNSIFLGKMIYADLAIAGVSIWDYWTAIERERWNQKNRFYLIRLRPNGGDYADLTAGGTVAADKNLWVLGNYSRFVRPGYKRVKLTGANDLAGLMGTSFIAPDTSEMVVVYVNWGTSVIEVAHNYNLPQGLYANNMVPYITNSIYNLSKQFAVSAYSNYSIPPKSIVTLAINFTDEPPTDIKKTEIQGNAIVFPNPTNGVFTLKGNGIRETGFKYKLFDAKGIVIHSGKTNCGEFECGALINKPNGLYFLETGNQVSKVMKY